MTDDIKKTPVDEAIDFLVAAKPPLQKEDIDKLLAILDRAKEVEMANGTAALGGAVAGLVIGRALKKMQVGKMFSQIASELMPKKSPEELRAEAVKLRAEDNHRDAERLEKEADLIEQYAKKKH